MSNFKDGSLPVGEMTTSGLTRTNRKSWQEPSQRPSLTSLVPPISRIPSTTTITQSRIGTPPSPRQALSRALRASGGSGRRPSRLEIPVKPLRDDEDSPSPVEDDSEESSSEDDDETPSTARSQPFKRHAIMNRRRLPPVSSDGDAEDDDDAGGYLPFAAAAKASKEDPSATLRDRAGKQTAALQPSINPKGKARLGLEDSSASSVSSAAPPSQTPSQSDSRPLGQGQEVSPGLLSPQRRAELAKPSPRLRKDLSDGTPSMGSSFSDLDGKQFPSRLMSSCLIYIWLTVYQMRALLSQHLRKPC